MFRGKESLALVALCATSVALAGCGPTLFARSAGLGDSGVDVQITPVVEERAKVNQPVVVVAENGTLANVSVSGPKGPMKGTYDNRRITWTSKASSLDFAATYRVEVTATDEDGAPTSVSKTIETMDPTNLVDLSSASVADDTTVGVGMPITLSFDSAIGKKKAVEEQLSVATSKPVVGAWNWESDYRVVYRPKKYWPSNTKVEVRAPLKGLKAAPGAYFAENTEINFATGDAMISVVDASSHTMTVRKNGELIRTIPITTGKAGFETRSGVKVISEKLPFVVMDASTVGTSEGDPEYYRLDVYWAMRMTNSGEFVHAAPWSAGSQGYANVSHGCVGMTTDSARWLYDESNVGDIVDVRNTGRYLESGNGITVWNESWREWQKRSITGAEPSEDM